ncbi:MAG TPA: carboxypeptidase M32, partial [Gaiellales bacterium]|nr:carboxypeptidase M32 [Gaiellales bacterium]
IILRFEIEQALLSGDLAVADLPGAWDAAFEAMFGLRPPDDARGCLQDIHWSFGGLGYFPTYTLGNLYSALLWDAYLKDDPAADDHIRAGEFQHVLGWMREHVHRAGAIDQGEDLIRRVTGSGLDHAPFMRYLWTKYRTLYSLA